MPVTAPIRTLIDLAACSRPSELEQAVAEAFAGGLTNRNAIAREIARSPRRAGLASIRRLLDLPSGPALTRSAPERRLLRAIRVGGLPEPETNVRVGPWEVDFLWREARLVVELDAYATHSAPDRFERDRIKDAYLADRGLRVRRVTARQVRADLDGTVAAIRRALKLSRPPRPGARPP